MPSTHETFLTVGEIARQLDVPLHRVEYYVRAHRIAHVGRAGNARVYTPADLTALARLLGVETKEQQHHLAAVAQTAVTEVTP